MWQWIQGPSHGRKGARQDHTLDRIPIQHKLGLFQIHTPSGKYTFYRHVFEWKPAQLKETRTNHVKPTQITVKISQLCETPAILAEPLCNQRAVAL